MSEQPSVTTRLVLLTGGTSGIGLATAHLIATMGYRLHLVARREETLAKVSARLSAKQKVTFTRLDLSDLDAIKDFAKAWDQPLYAIVNNAGAWGEARIVDKEGERLLAKLWRLNVAAPLALVSGLSQKLQRKGRVVNVISQLAHRGRAGFGAYCATKHALLGLTRCWALELAHMEVTVNAVSPGWVDTLSNRSTFQQVAEELSHDESVVVAALEKVQPRARLVTPVEVAECINFLLSPASAGISGQAIQIL